MMYWVREIAGWLLVGIGLLIFTVVWEYCERRWIFEAGILLVVGGLIFRGGIHLLKVAVAGRICREAQDRLYPAAPSGAGPRPTGSISPVQKTGSGARRVDQPNWAVRPTAREG